MGIKYGFLITLEGIEGSGKSTQAKLLSQKFQGQGIAVELTQEPGGSRLGNALRQALLEGPSVHPLTELFLFLADRNEHWWEVIQPALSDGKVVIVDRFLDSTVAYQGYGRGIDLNTIYHLNRMILSGEEPNVTILLDISQKGGLERLQGERDRIEKEDLAFHLRVREGYLKEAEKNPTRFLIYDASLEPDVLSIKIFEDVWERYQNWLARARRSENL